MIKPAAAAACTPFKFRGSVYGFVLESNYPLVAGLPQPNPSLLLSATFCRAKSWLSEKAKRDIYTGSWVRVRELRDGHHFEYADSTEFLVTKSGQAITAVTPELLTEEDTSGYLLGPILGFVLRLHDTVCLHACTVVIDGRAICFCGPPSAGKSTLAAAFAIRGRAVLAEDIAALDVCENIFTIRPGYPRVNLWPDSATTLCGSPDALPSITPNWGKRYLSLSSGGPKFHAEPAPLSAIYVLRSRIGTPDPIFKSLPPVQAMIALASNTYTPYLLNCEMRSREFDVLTRLIKNIPIRLIHPPAEISQIYRLCDGIEADIESIA